MHFPLGHLWRVIQYPVKQCKLLSQAELGWAGVWRRRGRENCSGCRKSNVDSIALSHWGPKDQPLHDGTRGGVGQGLNEIPSLLAPLYALFIYLYACIRVCVYVYKSQCFGLAPLRLATTGNVKFLQLQWGLISHWWKSEVIWGNPRTAFAPFFSWGGCGSSRLTVCTLPISRSRDLKRLNSDRAMGALRAARETTGFNLSAGKVGGERASNKVCFSRGFSWTVRKKQWLIFCIWERQVRKKGTGSRSQETAEGNTKSELQGKDPKTKKCSRKAVRASTYIIIF